MSKHITYCDNCADPLEWKHEQYLYVESPIDFDSGNKGESAVFCIECHQEAQKEIDQHPGFRELFTAWDEAEELVTSLNELNDNEIIECREDLKQRAKLIRDVLSPYVSTKYVRAVYGNL